MTATSIYLPRQQEPVFPKRCIVCLGDEPDAEAKYAHRAFKWATILVPILYVLGRRKSVRVPVCYGCRPRLRTQRGLRFCLMLISLIVGFSIAIPLVRAWEIEARKLEKLTTLAIALVFYAPYALFEVYRPPYFELTSGNQEVEYEFQDAAYAYEFAGLNDGRVE